MGYTTSFKIAGVGVVLAGSLLAGQVSASQISAHFDGVDPRKSVTVKYYGGTFNTKAGLFNFTKTGGDAPILTYKDGSDDKFVSFCIDVKEYVHTNNTWNLANLATAPEHQPLGSRATDLAKLLGSNIGAKLNDAVSVLNTNEKAAAMQLAVWEVVNESQESAYNVKTGNSKFWNIDDSVRNLANVYLGNITNIGTEMVGLKALTKVGTQDFVVQAVPLPAAAWFFGSALLGAGFVSRRRKQQLAA